jgi:FkbM family methyltransferase
MLARLKHTVRNYLARRLELPEIPVALRRLAGLGFTPNLVFDAGAYRGDFARLCLELWPDTRVACFEVQKRILPELEQLAARAAGVSVFPTLLGSATRDAVELYEAETASSVLIESAGPRHPSNSYRMTTVDAVVAGAFGGHPPNLLKIDVQGYELEVLKGATATLPGVDVILAEINLLDIHDQVPLLADVVGWLAARGFVAFDICALTRRPLDRALWQCDMLFVPAGSAFRQDKRWGIASA